MLESDPDLHQPISAAEFVRNFARLREAALQHPVFVSNHGRVSHVLASVELFGRLQGVGTAAIDPDMRQAALFGLADWVDDAVVVVDANEDLIYANRVAMALCRLELPIDTALNLRLAMPQMRDSLLEVNLRRTLDSREPTTADMPSPFTPGAWLHVRSFPLRENVVILLRDITREVQFQRLADLKKAMIGAITLHDAVGYTRLTVRGTIERADPTFCEWVGLLEERLLGVPLVDLIDRADRARFREGLEHVLTGTEDLRTMVRLVPNRSGVVAVECAVVQMHGAYGVEGAVIVFTRHEKAADA